MGNIMHVESKSPLCAAAIALANAAGGQGALSNFYS